MSDTERASGVAQDGIDSPEAGPRVIRGSTLRIVGYAAGVGLATVSTAFLLRELGTEDTGRYITVLTLAVLAAGITDAGLSTVGLREYAVRPAGQRELVLRNIVTLRLVLTFVGMLGACAYAALAGFGATLVAGTAIAAVGVLAQTLQNGVGTVLVAELRLGWVTAAELLRQLVGTLVIVALVVAGAQLLPYFAATALGAFAGFVLTIVVVRKAVLLRPAWTPPLLRELLRDTLPFAAATAAAALYLRVGMLVVERLASPTETGYYGASFRVVEALIALPALAVLTAFPVFARAARDDLPRLAYAVQRTFEAALLLGAGIAVVLGVAAPVVIEVLGGAALEPAAAVLRLHALAVAVAFLSPVLGYALLSLRAHRAILVQALCALTTLLVASFVLTELDGARGAALAAVVAELVLVGAGIVALRRHGITLDLTPVLRIGAATAVAILPALVLPALPAAVLCGALFAGAAFAVGAVPAELTAELRRRVGAGAS